MSNGYPNQALARFETPSQTVMNCETQNNNYYRYRLSPNSDWGIDSTARFVHSRGTNIAHVDGHVAHYNGEKFSSGEPTADLHWWPHWPY